MTEPGGRASRNPERTRQAVLEAAARLLTERGTAMSLAEVATAAKVSKSGLLHHFGSRDELILAVVRYTNEKFRARVMRHLDLSENRPGKMLRAYVRALCGGDAYAPEYFFVSLTTWNGIQSVEGVNAAFAEDREWWDEQFTLDGMDPDLAHLIQRACEGIAAAAAFGDETPDRLTRARDRLLTMTDSATFPA
ncbi:transcriptional regulator, TetR family [Streptomyces zhaozhouensis]|uniref:Transcriptional regulator, TetR family n=1 Tax=Streptomyces zhaozhouensis TaxID=1300267 RepID=A0A286E698_9ACTN|nr:TetR/AcrR family transcriptional regulator [Streptomyces zhaozhouensis]SOD66427.1 transcriptional regulator, TetR family [Streptomyces zhaozhouensis]